MTNSKEIENSSNSPLECRIILLENGYERLEKKVDKLEDKVDRLFDKMNARFEQFSKDIGSIRVEMRDMIWKIPTIILAVIMTVIGGMAKCFHWL